MGLEELRRWLVPKIQWTVIMLGMLCAAYLAILAIERARGSRGSQRQRGGYLYSKPPEVCYCWDCGRAIDMRAHGLYGRHCREIECPYCGSRNVWRARP